MNKPSIDIKILPESLRDDFPSLQNEQDGKRPIYFDSACTTLVPNQVINALNQYYREFPGCGGGRSRYWFAEEVNDRIQGNDGKSIKGSRRIIGEFINAGSQDEIIFTMNTSHAINMVALGFNFQPGDAVLVSDREHNSNLIPWLRLQDRGLIEVMHFKLDDDGNFDPDAYEKILKNNNIRLVSMAYTSNLTGHTIAAENIIKIAHKHGARVLLDGAQTVPHRAINVRDLDVDFLAFSIHKMCGPRGIGVLYAKKELLRHGTQETARGDMLEPSILGGGTVGDSTYESYNLLNAPESFEAGIQDYAGQIAAGTAMEYLQSIGMEKIYAHESGLNNFLTKRLLGQYGDTGWFRILGPQDAAQRGGILTFEVKRPNAVRITEELNAKSRIMIRDGVFCCHSYFNDRLGLNWMRPRPPSEHRMTYRISLYFYNTIDECKIFLETLQTIFRERSYIE